MASESLVSTPFSHDNLDAMTEWREGDASMEWLDSPIDYAHTAVSVFRAVEGACFPDRPGLLQQV
jgi:hypothetical protein